MSDEKLFDVVVYEIETGIIAAIPGKSLSKSFGFHNAVKRLGTVLGRINTAYYDAKVVPAGTYKVGGVLEDGE